MSGLTEEQLQLASILGGDSWSARRTVLFVPDLLINAAQDAVGLKKLHMLGLLLAAAHRRTPRDRRRKKPMNVDKLVDLWTDVLVALAVAHDPAARSAADERTDELLGPLLTAPIKQLREFSQKLAVRLREDERVPFLVWSTFERLIAPLLMLGPEGQTIALKTTLAQEIAELVERDLDRADLIAAIASALQWRAPRMLEQVKSGLKAGAKARLRGGESCLFLRIVDPEGKELAQVVL